MNSEEFKCVFCQESFGDKEALQIHFRKHGNKNFHEAKGRVQDELTPSDNPASSKEQAEMVECDVCPKVFTSISKAITHKHRVHPEHDAKYFCPWCGKLFTMKHLYNKHISTNHPHDEKSDDVYFHCDSCDVTFNIPAAVVYHNKFFHRIQEMPTIGNSKKLKMACQEAVQIYYCPFCGEEYDNKVNLHKHMTDDHSDEEQQPEDVLRCPLCNAIFYHLDAYELHLTYHSIDDLYSDRSEIIDEITDFSLEAVPPIAEKVETLEPLGDEEQESMGIEQLFELTMDDSKQKKKKHKKHKKSKKEAITLDQFFNMNKDVFGEGIDFHGIEEVPTQAITKRLKKPIKAPVQSMLPSNIEKLRRQGIVIKKKIGTTPVKSLGGPKNVKSSYNTTQGTKVNPDSFMTTKSSTLATPNDVLTKLINQNNSQIKIVKKSIGSQNTKDDSKEIQQDIHSPIANDSLDTTESNGVASSPIREDSNNFVTDQQSKLNDIETENAYPNNTVRKNPCYEKNNDDGESNHSQSILDEEQIKAVSPLTDFTKVTSDLRDNTNLEKTYQQSDSSEGENNDTNDSKDSDETEIEDTEECNKDTTERLSPLFVKPATQETIQESNTTSNVPVKDNAVITDFSKIAHLLRKKPVTNELKTTHADGKESQAEVDKISCLIKNKPTSSDIAITHNNDKDAAHSEISSKISHLLRNKPRANELDSAHDNHKSVVQTGESTTQQGIQNKASNECASMSVNEAISQTNVSKIAHLIRDKTKPTVMNNTPAIEKVTCPNEVKKIAHLIKSQPASNDLVTTPDKNIQECQSEVGKITQPTHNRLSPNETEDTQDRDKKVDQTVSKIAHLIRSKPTPKEVKSSSLREAKDNELGMAEVSKIAHLVRNNPANMISTDKKSKTIVSQSLNKEFQTGDNNLESDNKANEDSDTNIEATQAEKLASFLNKPHLNIHPILKSPIALPDQESQDEYLRKSEKSSADLLKHLKNVTAKPVGTTVNTVSISSPKASSKLQNAIKKEPPVKITKIMEKDIEIFNIDDSDSDEATSNGTHITKSIQMDNNSKSGDVLKNINKNVTIKSVNNNVNITNKVMAKEPAKPMLQEFDSDCDDEVDNAIHLLHQHNNSNSQKFNKPAQEKQSAISNVLRNLSKNITVKSGNTSPSQFAFQGHTSSIVDDNDAESETDSLPDRVKITEMDDASDDELEKAVVNSTTQDNVKVQCPDDSNSDQEERDDDEPNNDNFSDDDVESQINASSLNKDAFAMSNSNLDSLKHLSKDMVIKPSSQKSLAPACCEEIPLFAKSLSNQISIKNMKQMDNCNKQVQNISNSRIEQLAGRLTNKGTMNQKMSSNVVNKEVKTVKTFQTKTGTKTVIQEITTTVTKTVKTVNQSLKQEVKQMSQSTPKRVQQANMNNQFQGMKVGQASIVGPRVRNPGITTARPIRPSNQLVLARPRFSGLRQNTPRMPNIRPSTSRQPLPQIGAHVKVAPGIMTGKRPNSNEEAGHFSCFKKPKESLFPETDYSTSKHDGESFSSAVQLSKSNFASTTKTVKGNSIVTSTQVKSEMSASSQQVNKLRNMSGLSIVKTNQANQSRVEEKSEVNLSKQNTLNAIQRLQSQGLLVKKPRLSEESEHSNQSEQDHYSDEEFDS